CCVTVRPRVSQAQEVTAPCASWPTTCSKQQPLPSGDRGRHGYAACGRPRHEARLAPQPAATLQHEHHPSLLCATTPSSPTSKGNLVLFDRRSIALLPRT